MKKRAILSLVTLLFASAASVSAGFVADHGAPFYTTVAEGQEAAAKAGTPMVVKFYTDW